jgi:haloalkane dehalogenase
MMVSPGDGEETTMANPTPGRRPDWVDDELFPFESRFTEIDGNVVHYVDEGDGPTLLLYHGNPTWSFLYRDLIAGLRDRFRCVAFDYPGMGLSSASARYGYTVAEHADVAEALVEQLDLTGITPVVQDWGGPIGLSVAGRHPERYRALIIGNTWAWHSPDLRTRAFSGLLGGPLGRFAIGRWNVFVTRIVPRGHTRRRPTEAEMAQYEGPYPDVGSRAPTHVFPREILAGEDLVREAEAAVDRLAGLPSLIVWGTADFAFTDAVRQRWEDALTDATTVLLDGAGHYIQDDAPDEIVTAIDRWWPTVAASDG